MGGFTLHPLLPALKVRVTALHHHGDRIYVGTATGAVQIYSFDLEEGEAGPSTPRAKLQQTHQLSKRPIDQIGALDQTKQLVVLTDSVVTLYNSSDLAKNSSVVLSQARSAHCFAITPFTSLSKKRSLKNIRTADVGASEKVTKDLLVVGCRKKVVVYNAGRGGFKEGWELVLPHSPRHIVIPSPPSSSLPESLHLLYSPQSSVILHLQPSATPHLNVTEVTTAPVPPPTSGAISTSGIAATSTGQSEGAGLGIGGGMSALTGLGGYVGLGAKAAAPLGTRTAGGEVLLARDELGVFYSSEGNHTRPESLRWPSSPDTLDFSSPYIYSGVSLTTSSSSASPTCAIQVHLAATLSLRDTIPLPSPSAGGLAFTSAAAISRPSNSPADTTKAAPKLCVVSTPTDKALLQAEGSSLWCISARDVGDDVDDLVRRGRLADAIGLVEAVGEHTMSPSRRLPHLKTLQAVQHFAKGEYQAAIDTFLVYNVNPALVVALFPADTISGPLHVPRERWMELFGAVPGASLEPEITAAAEESGGKGLLQSVANLTIGKKPSIDSLRPTAPAPTGDGGVVSPPPEQPKMDEHTLPRPALEALMYYLSDRRQKLTGAMNALRSPLPAESSLPPLSSLPASDLHQLPSEPLGTYEPEQLLRAAQVIYTALLKVYLVARPILVGSLCRIENWCDVAEVEELLKQQKKFGDLIDLYQGKKMHAKALGMLQQLAKDEEGRLDRYPPTVRYLQKLGPSELPLILDASKWIFDEDAKEGLQIFVADEAEVEALPRKDIVAFLDKTSKDACVGYLEHIINVLHEEGADFHDKLAEMYLDRTKSAKGEDIASTKARLFDFLNTSDQYRAYRILNRLAADELPEARAILLGRMGRHDDALKIYVYRLKDYPAAEVYCSRVYAKDPDPHGIYLMLLRLYLRPDPKISSDILIAPALALIAKQGTRLDAQEVLDLLPPLLTMEEVKHFFLKTLREGHAKRNDHRVVKQLLSARKEETERILMGLQVKRVRITDQRICPQCHKRLGVSAIAVHAPRGEVTHLHCKDAFSARLAKLRE